jgi:hypothetical protein
MTPHCPVAALAREYASLLSEIDAPNLPHAFERQINERLEVIRTNASYLTPASPEGVRFLLQCIETEANLLADGIGHLPAVQRMLSALAPQEAAQAA